MIYIFLSSFVLKSNFQVPICNIERQVMVPMKQCACTASMNWIPNDDDYYYYYRGREIGSVGVTVRF